MSKKCRGILYLFIFATLFLFTSYSQVFAISVNELIEGHQIYKYRTEGSTNENEALYSYEVIKLPFNKNQIIYDEGTGAIKLYENDIGIDYISFSITYAVNGEEIVEEPTVGFDRNGNYLLRLSQEIPEGSPYYLSVTETIDEKDQNGNSIGIVERTTSTSEREFQLDSTEIIAEPEGTSWLSAGWSALHGDLAKIGKILVETFCDVLVPVGDAFLDMICNSVGEVVTIDGVVYNRVSKLDIDFFTNSNGDIEGNNMTLTSSLKSIMGNVVNKLYVFFRNIVIVFYMAMLVYIAIKILATSTAEKKADYKSIFMAWVMGVVMLMFFPYVMKYTIQLNDALCKMISQDIGQSEVENAPTPVNGLVTSTYGTDDFVNHMLLNGERNTNNNAMLNVRVIGAMNKNLPLIIVYFIFIGQLLAILIMYYKRVFMIAFLISIFPIVVAIYPLNKIGDIRMNPFGEWFKEFAVNVFVQSFHATTYKVIVSIGVKSYIGGGQNWLFLIISVLFLFEGEKLIRAIFNAKSSANTIGDMAMAGAFAMKMMKDVGSALPSVNKEKEEEDENAGKKKAKKDVAKSTPTQATTSNMHAVSDITSGSGSTSGTDGSTSGASRTSGAASSSPGTGTPINTETNTINSSSSAGATGPTTVDNRVDKTVDDKKMGRFSKPIANAFGTGFSMGAQLTGGVVGTTYGLAQNNAKESYNAATAGFVSGISTGKAIGKSGKKVLSGGFDKISSRRAARIVAEEYESGAHDDEIGINEADRQLNSERAEAIRRAYANYARRSNGWRGKTGAQLDFYKAQMKILNESLDRNKD